MLVVAGRGPAPGWSGKVAAMAAGVAAAGEPDLYLFTDADIAYPPDALAELVAASEGFDLVSQMVRLRCEGSWERLLVPAFVYFAQLYPFSRVNRPGRTAAAVRADAPSAPAGSGWGSRIRSSVCASTPR